MTKQILLPTVASFFSGAGGLDEGFRVSGYKIIFCMDIESWACDSLRANNKEAVIIGPPKYSGNIKNIAPQEFQEMTGIGIGDIDVFVGCPPCQPFSRGVAKRKGFQDLDRGTLLFDYIEYIKYFKPKVFLFENVPGLLTMDQGKQLNLALHGLSAIGYTYTIPQVINAVNYGVPQLRSRVIIWGTMVTGIKPTLPTPTHGNGGLLREYNTVAQALQNMGDDLPNHVPRKHSEETVASYKKLLFGERSERGRVDRLDPIKPSKTVIAGSIKGGGKSNLHPYIARTLTVRECARLQTFADDFVFKGIMARQFTQVGNAVPPLLAEHFARKIGVDVFGLKYDDEYKFEKPLLHNESIELIADKLLQTSLKIKPEWCYHTQEKH